MNQLFKTKYVPTFFCWAGKYILLPDILSVAFLILHSLLTHMESDYGSECSKLKIKAKDMSYRTLTDLRVMIAVCFF